MCAEYQLDKNTEKEILEFLEREYRTPIEHRYASRIRLFSEAPIVHDDDFKIAPMHFSLKPPSMKYATFNARLYDYDLKTDKVVSIAEKRTWKKPLAETRCLVPMSGFVEPIYTGEHAGEMVEFKDRKLPLLFAAGIYETSMDPKTGRPYTGFSIIMDHPNDFIRKTGHHRQPVFLKRDAFGDWLSADLQTDDAIQILNTAKQPLDLTVKTDRKMAKGWEKRVAAFLEKSEKELHFEELRKEHEAPL